MSTMNRMHNASNPNQTKAKRVLCVCSAGLLRSPTMANVLHKEFGWNTRAVGCSLDYALIEIDRVQIHWADEVWFADKEHYEWSRQSTEDKTLLKDKYKVILNIPDKYPWGDPELEGLILQQARDHEIMAKAKGI